VDEVVDLLRFVHRRAHVKHTHTESDVGWGTVTNAWDWSKSEQTWEHT